MKKEKEQKQATPLQVIDTAINKAFKSGVFDANEAAMVLNALAGLRQQLGTKNIEVVK